MNGTLSRSTNNATKPQVELVNKLIKELREFDDATAEAIRQNLRRAWGEGRATTTFVSENISGLIEVLGRHRAACRATQQTRTALPQVPAGRYAVANAEGVLAFYKVEENAGHYQVFVQASDELHKLRYTAFRSVLAKIDEVGVLEASIAYGKAIGVCGRCGRTLTHPESRAAGIGPICRAKFGS